MPAADGNQSNKSHFITQVSECHFLSPRPHIKLNREIEIPALSLVSNNPVPKVEQNSPFMRGRSYRLVADDGWLILSDRLLVSKKAHQKAQLDATKLDTFLFNALPFSPLSVFLFSCLKPQVFCVCTLGNLRLTLLKAVSVCNSRIGFIYATLAQQRKPAGLCGRGSHVINITGPTV